MSTVRLTSVCVDCADPWALASWWAPLLGYALRDGQERDEAGIVLDPPDGSDAPTVWSNRVPEPKVGKDRIHLDVRGDWQSVVTAGAGVVLEQGDDIGRTVLADPEGNEFCVFADQPAADD